MYNWSLQREGEVSEKKHSQKITEKNKTKQNYKFTGPRSSTNLKDKKYEVC